MLVDHVFKMEDKMKKICFSILVGLVLAGLSYVFVKGATLYVDGYISTSNPIYSEPYANATTCGYRSLTAVCEVSKSGYPTRSTSISGTDPITTHFFYVVTDDIYGPTWASSGTSFTSYHSGYNYYGEYQTLSDYYYYD